MVHILPLFGVTIGRSGQTQQEKIRLEISA